jgi:endonuclease/exonuclease/phosphatase (EEP) superfamily protein YafD
VTEIGAAADRGHGWLSSALTIGGWLIVGGLAALVVARLVAWDRWQPLVVADALTNFVFFPAWVVVPAAFLSHRRALAVLAGVVVIAHVALVLPELTAERSLPAIAGQPGLVIFDANVNQSNTNMRGYASIINNDKPDIVTLEEATPAHSAALAATGALHALPYQFEVPRDDSRGFLLASRYPLTDTRVVDLEGVPLAVRTDVTVDNRTIRLWVVHTVAPVGPSWREWSDQLSALAQMLKADRAPALLVVGDFNATWGNRGFRRILSLGLTDAAAGRGHPLEMTWSETIPLLPPLVRIDHILTNRGIVISRIHDGPGPGSDHRSLLAQAVLTEVEKTTNFRTASRIGRLDG